MVGYCAALALTLAIEVPAYASILSHGLSVSRRRGVAAGVAVNLLSHPLAFLVVMPRVTSAFGFVAALTVVEVGVWVFEAALLWIWLRRDVDLLGLAALFVNAMSLFVGLLILG